MDVSWPKGLYSELKLSKTYIFMKMKGEKVRKVKRIKKGETS